MNLRRAMVAAAATAVIAPLALLSAPAAFAEEPTSPGPTESVTTGPAETPSGSTSPSDTGLPTDTAQPSDSTSPSDTPAPSDSTSPSTSPEPSESADPTETPSDPEAPYCEDLDGAYGAKVSADIKGLPGKIVAGDGFHSFKLVVTNDSKADVEDVYFYAEIENYEFDDEAKYLSPYVNLQFKNPVDGSWDRIGDEQWAGDVFFRAKQLKAGASKSIDLRVSIDAKAPAGDAYSFGSGAYLDDVDGESCVAEGWAMYDFQVLKAGSPNPDPGSATPSDKGGKGSVKKPQGDLSSVPTGNLADTGSNSALPMIGLVGGIAVVAGAGAVFTVRRRKADANA
ncbi:LAETG motif-containing sortase-dependent surface protein [Streptomyces sp. NPDC004629]|uniref:LAETG motif-containing sortase-dependent surface protein n=1 Tax=Streptomyces sp. NPDC004629 TaxID=3364705 RepID=UPI00367759E4